MRRLLILALSLTGTASATVTIDAEFWDNYAPFGQYTPTTIDDLLALEEGDLLETSRGSDGLVVRVLGRYAPNSSLVSARIAIDNQSQHRLQVKVVPFALARDETRPPQIYRRPVGTAQIEELFALLDRWNFWDAPYGLDRPGGEHGSGCDDSADGWIIEGFEHDRYQIIMRSNCGGLEPAAAELRDFLLGLADVAPE